MWERKRMSVGCQRRFPWSAGSSDSLFFPKGPCVRSGIIRISSWWEFFCNRLKMKQTILGICRSGLCFMEKPLKAAALGRLCYMSHRGRSPSPRCRTRAGLALTLHPGLSHKHHEASSTSQEKHGGSSACDVWWHRSFLLLQLRLTNTAWTSRHFHHIWWRCCWSKEKEEFQWCVCEIKFFPSENLLPSPVLGLCMLLRPSLRVARALYVGSQFTEFLHVTPWQRLHAVNKVHQHIPQSSGVKVHPSEKEVNMLKPNKQEFSWNTKSKWSGPKLNSVLNITVHSDEGKWTCLSSIWGKGRSFLFCHLLLWEIPFQNPQACMTWKWWKRPYVHLYHPVLLHNNLPNQTVPSIKLAILMYTHPPIHPSVSC